MATDTPPVASSLPKSGVGRPPLSSTYSRIIKIAVGSPAKEFEVHESLLRHYSEFFDIALKNDFKEAKEGVVTLEEETTDTFKLFVNFIYFGKLFEDKMQSPDATSSDDKKAKWFHSRGDILCDLWIFGDKFHIPDLQDRVIEELHQAIQDSGAYYQSSTIAKVYGIDRPEFKLRKLIVEHAFAVRPSCAHELDLPAEFLSDVVTRFCEGADKGAVLGKGQVLTALAKINLCDFHVHQADVKSFPLVRSSSGNPACNQSLPFHPRKLQLHLRRHVGNSWGPNNSRTSERCWRRASQLPIFISIGFSFPHKTCTLWSTFRRENPKFVAVGKEDAFRVEFSKFEAPIQQCFVIGVGSRG